MVTKLLAQQVVLASVTENVYAHLLITNRKQRQKKYALTVHAREKISTGIFNVTNVQLIYW